ncbi:hypothetical protein [uncultured Leclercia sp.]|uniref:hypothetical protein n=1 Tax=uncultured Leclercia sp. TaxID=332959 RepID=UPI0025927AAA|nr:hypothetical protein [uncultured Leclercia sp.]
MSVIAQYYFRQINNTATVRGGDAPAAPAANPPAAAATSQTAPFEKALIASRQPGVPMPAAEASAPKPAARPATNANANATPTLAQLVKFAQAQGWSQKQIALLKRLALRKNSRTGQPWRSTATPAGQRQASSLRTDPGLMSARGDASQIRGIRNNNPGNIESSELFRWQGQSGSDGRFAVFNSPEHGIRALGMNLLAYHRRGLDTIHKIISRWAPPTDNNDTASYVNKVSQALGVSPHSKLDIQSPAILGALSKAIIQHENGVNPFDEKTVSSGIFSALGLENLTDTATRVVRTAQAIPGQTVYSLQARQMSVKALHQLQQALTRQVKAVTIVMNAGGEATGIPSKAEFVAAWGYTEGTRRFNDLKLLQERSVSRLK